VILDEVLGPSLTEDQAREIYRQGEEAVVVALIKLATQLAAASRAVAPPTTPSAMIPAYQKPTTTKSRKKPGAKKGHKGCRRPPPQRIDQRREHRLALCPHCQGQLKRCQETRTRYIEDIPEGITPVVTEHTICGMAQEWLSTFGPSCFFGTRISGQRFGKHAAVAV